MVYTNLHIWTGQLGGGSPGGRGDRRLRGARCPPADQPEQWGYRAAAWLAVCRRASPGRRAARGVMAIASSANSGAGRSPGHQRCVTFTSRSWSSWLVCEP